MAEESKLPPSDEERAKWAAEAEKFRAEARKAGAEADKAEAEATVAVLAKLRAERSYAEDQASDKYHHLYVFTDQVAAQSVRTCIGALAYWRRMEPGCPVELMFCSPGGSVVDGMVLYDYLQDLRRGGHRITTSTMGMAASMAGILVQAGDVRRMHREAWMLIHEVAFGAIGKIADIEDTVDWAKRMQERILDIFATRCKAAAEAGTAKHPLTKKMLKAKWRRKAWWISSDAALAWGLVDEVR